MGPYQVLPLWVRKNQRVMAIKEYFTFPKAAGLEPHYQMQDTYCGRSNPSAEMDPPKKRPCATLSRSVGRGTNTAEMQPVYFTTPANWAVFQTEYE